MGLGLFHSHHRHPTHCLHRIDVPYPAIRDVADKDDEHTDAWRRLCAKPRIEHPTLAHNGDNLFRTSCCCRHSVLRSYNVRRACCSASCPCCLPHFRPSLAYACNPRFGHLSRPPLLHPLPSSRFRGCLARQQCHCLSRCPDNCRSIAEAKLNNVHRSQEVEERNA